MKEKKRRYRQTQKERKKHKGKDTRIKTFKLEWIREVIGRGRNRDSKIEKEQRIKGYEDHEN